MAYLRIRFRFFDDSFDEVFADFCAGYARTADAAKNDDLSDACDDAFHYVERACRIAFILVLGKYRQFCPAIDHQLF